MKWCFLVSEPIFFKEFFWKFAQQVAREGDECLIVVDGKIAEYGKKYTAFPKQIKFLSKVDWCLQNYNHNQDKNSLKDFYWRSLFPDFVRYKPLTFNYTNSVEIISQLYQFMEFVFETEKPDIVVSGVPPNLFEQVVYHFSRKYKVPYLGLMESILGENRTEIYDLEYTNSQFRLTFEQLQEKDISEKEREFCLSYIDELTSHKQVPYYMESQGIYLSKLELFKCYIQRLKILNDKKRILFKYIRRRKYFKRCDYRSEIILRHIAGAFWNEAKQQFRILFQKRIFRFLDEKDLFFLYPLHFQPEFTTSILATYYSDQLTTVRNIAFSLPFPYKLYVKEHPAAVGTKPNNFYKKLEQIPNVVLISPDESVPNLIKKASGIITLTSTIGLEGALSGKQVYVLGKVFYAYHPACKKINNFDDLKEKIKDDLKNKKEIADLEEINLLFITSYLRNTLVGSVVSAYSHDDIDNYKIIYRDIKKVLKEKRTKI